MKTPLRIFDFYLFRALATAFVFVSVILAVVIILTQSLRFLELIINSGAGAGTFWVLTFLALPRFFEVIFPLSLMIGTLFVYQKMNSDSELVVIRSAGYSPLKLAKPALVLSMIVTCILWFSVMWAGPKALMEMQQMRQVIKSQVSMLIFRDGVFNALGNGLTVYIRKRMDNGELRGLMIHDRREETKMPSTTMAQRGVIVASDQGQQVVVYDGSRQEFDPETKNLRRLDFDRYTIDLPDAGPIRQRWQEADERTITELLNPNMNDGRDLDRLREFKIEIHKRVVGPLLTFSFTLVSLCCMLLGPISRKGQAQRVALAVGIVTIIQGLFLAIFNMARQSDVGLIAMYLIVLLPIAGCLFLLSPSGEKTRWHLLQKGLGS